MKRREFITLLGGAAAAWPLAARAQQRIPRVGFLFAGTPSVWSKEVAAFAQRLGELGWIEGRTVAIEYRWVESRTERLAAAAAEFVELKVDVIVTPGTAVPAVKQVTSVIPIVFPLGSDPVASGFVASLARPGGNVTGFTTFEYWIGAKWLELLKEIAPGVKRAAVLRDNPANPAGSGQWGAIQSVAPSFGVELSAVNMGSETGEIERAVAAFVRQANSGLILTASAGVAARRDRLIARAARNKLPAVYPYPYYVASGGLISYGPDPVDQYRRAAGYTVRATGVSVRCLV